MTGSFSLPHLLSVHVGTSLVSVRYSPRPPCRPCIRDYSSHPSPPTVCLVIRMHSSSVLSWISVRALLPSNLSSGGCRLPVPPLRPSTPLQGHALPFSDLASPIACSRPMSLPGNAAPEMIDLPKPWRIPSPVSLHAPSRVRSLVQLLSSSLFPWGKEAPV